MDIFDLLLVALNYFEKVDYFDRKKIAKIVGNLQFTFDGICCGVGVFLVSL